MSKQQLIASWTRRPFWAALDFYAIAILTLVGAYAVFERALGAAGAISARDRFAAVLYGCCALSLVAGTANLIQQSRKLVSLREHPELAITVFRWRAVVLVFAFLFFGAATSW